MKAEAAELKKIEKERQKWEKGKFALQYIVAEIDAKVVESGSIGGRLLISESTTT
jgi:crossover junction endonuclease EME1